MKDTSMELLAEVSWWYPRTMQAIAIVSWLLTWTWRYDPTAENTHVLWSQDVEKSSWYYSGSFFLLVGFHQLSYPPINSVSYSERPAWQSRLVDALEAWLFSG